MLAIGYRCFLPEVVAHFTMPRDVLEVVVPCRRRHLRPVARRGMHQLPAKDAVGLPQQPVYLHEPSHLLGYVR